METAGQSCWRQQSLHLSARESTSNPNQKQLCFFGLKMRALDCKEGRRAWTTRSGVLLLSLVVALTPVCAQSDRVALLLGGGTWHLHGHIPLGNDSLLLEPGHHTVELLASAECPQFEGWSLAAVNNKPVLLDAAGKSVKELPRSMTFRVTLIRGAKMEYENPMPIDYSKDPDQLLLDIHFKVQIFRGMAMRQIDPVRTWMIGVPEAESSNERIYRVRFDWGKVLPDDRIVLLVTDGAGMRLTKFHLEFL